MDEIHTIEAIYQTLSIHKGLVLYDMHEIAGAKVVHDELLKRDFPVAFIDERANDEVTEHNRLFFVPIQHLGYHISKWLWGAMGDIDIVLLLRCVDIPFFKRLSRRLPVNERGRLIVKL